MVTASEVLNAALGLETRERAEVAHRLLLSLEPADLDEDVDQAWAEEVRRRLLAIREGRTTLLDWDEALSDIRKSISSPGGT
ncbi:MAG: addiction module protein [Planctomycetes bacterium]|nr:addiction module protein [Planctomycetota bacterium]